MLTVVLSTAARADITVGAILSITGPAAALGGPERKAVELMPATIAGQKVRYVVLDDATDMTGAVQPEPPRVCRRLVFLSHAAIGSVSSSA